VIAIDSHALGDLLKVVSVAGAVSGIKDDFQPGCEIE
jgi:hypothetical protein